MTRKQMLGLRLEEAFRAGRHHSFLASLKGVSEEDAVWTPPHYRGFPYMTGSILNLAYHTGGDKHVLLSVSFGDGSIDWGAVERRFRELGGNLAAARRLAEEGHASVLTALKSLAEPELDSMRPYYGGKRVSAADLFGIVAEHDVYHAGQIHYVRNLLSGLKR